MKNSILLSAQLYPLIHNARPNLFFTPECPDNIIYIIDSDGHAHILLYQGRLIDSLISTPKPEPTT